MTNSTVGEKIKYIRDKNNLSQFKFASEIGVSESTVFRWEIGERIPSKPHAKKIVETFDVPQDWFMEVFDTEIFDPTTKAEILKSIDTTTVGGRIQFLRVSNEMPHKQFADEFAVKTAVLLRWERNQSKPTGPKAMKIAEKFGVSLKWLLNGDVGDESPQNVDTSNFGARIKFLRERSKMSHRVFASKIGVSPYMPGRWEKDYIPSKSNLRKMAELFNVSIDWLRDGVGDENDGIESAENLQISGSGAKVGDVKSVEFAGENPFADGRSVKELTSEKIGNFDAAKALAPEKQYVLTLLAALSEERQGRLLGYLDALCMEEMISGNAANSANSDGKAE